MLPNPFKTTGSQLSPQALNGTRASSSTIQARDESYSPEAALRNFFSRRAYPLDHPEDLEPLYEAIGERRFVLLGEASHGTHDYYTLRAEISKTLIVRKGFQFVAVEGDWPSIAPLNDYVKGRTATLTSARDLMRAVVTRWPEWMWANEEFADFVEWLRAHNEQRPEAEKVGLYGMDIQDPGRSIEHVLDWFKQHDMEYHGEAEGIYQQMLDFPQGFHGYARHIMRGGERLDMGLAAVVERLRTHQGSQPLQQLDRALWASLQNAKSVSRAEAQFYGSASDGAESWNARASYMHEAMLHLAERHGAGSRGIVWAHNTHVGDSDATSMRYAGQINIGHLARESEGEDEVFIVGFGSHHGEVIAGPSWGGQRQKMTVPPARKDSYEALLHEAHRYGSSGHETGLDGALLLFDQRARRGNLLTPKQQRAIGVVYRPPQEAYVPTVLTQRYDALIYLDETSALAPL